MIFDTGSGNLWVTSSNCKAYACKIHPSFDNKKSTKYRKLGGGVEVKFGSGTIIGEINQDQFIYFFTKDPKTALNCEIG